VHILKMYMPINCVEQCYFLWAQVGDASLLWGMSAHCMPSELVLWLMCQGTKADISAPTSDLLFRGRPCLPALCVRTRALHAHAHLQALVAHLALDLGAPDRVERCVLHLDVTSMDLDQVRISPLCDTHAHTRTHTEEKAKGLGLSARGSVCKDCVLPVNVTSMVWTMCTLAAWVT